MRINFLSSWRPQGAMCRLLLVLVATALVVGAAPPARKKGKPPARAETTTGETSSTLSMSPAIVCATIDGYEQFERLPGAQLTSDDKLLVYYRPLRFRVEQKGDSYVAHLAQDGRVRRKGQKAVLFSKDKMVDHEAKYTQPFDRLYIRSIVSLKGLKPGEYEFDIVLHDELAKGAPATQTVSFRVVPPAASKDGTAISAPKDRDSARLPE
jgi:hypothetical protein